MNGKVLTIVFDFDGVLVDSNDIKREAYGRIFRGRIESTSVIGEVLFECPEADRFGTIRAILRRFGSVTEDDVRRYADLYNEICEREVVGAEEVEGATKTLQILGLKYPLFVNSGTYQAALRRIVQARGWGNHFQGVFGSPASKVENLVRIATQQSARPEDLVLVGDSQVDEEAAGVFGCRFIAFRFSGNQGSRTIRVDQLPQLAEVL